MVRGELYGVEDNNTTYYIVPDALGNTAIIIEDAAVVNRLDYDHLGKIRNETTTPQVDLLFRKTFRAAELGLDIRRDGLYDVNTGEEIVRILADSSGGGGGGGDLDPNPDGPDDPPGGGINTGLCNEGTQPETTEEHTEEHVVIDVYIPFVEFDLGPPIILS